MGLPGSQDLSSVSLSQTVSSSWTQQAYDQTDNRTSLRYIRISLEGQETITPRL